MFLENWCFQRIMGSREKKNKGIVKRYKDLMLVKRYKDLMLVVFQFPFCMCFIQHYFVEHLQTWKVTHVKLCFIWNFW